jgi:hypothetical protein
MRARRGLIAILIATTVTACGGGGDESQAQATPSPEDSAAAAAEARRLAQNRAAAEREARIAAEASAAAAALPEPAAFTIGIDILEKKCFGSAGCNVTFRIDPKFAGPGDASSTEVTYEVRGGSDPLINTFTIDAAGTASFDSEELISTPSAAAELTAKAIRVRRT